MIPRNYQNLLVLVGNFVPKIVGGIIVIPEIADIACQHEHITNLLKGMLSQIAPVIGKLQMEVGCELYPHAYSNTNAS